MFFFRKTKTSFEQYYREITLLPVVKECDCYKPITAAYLFVLSDYVLMISGRPQDRENEAQKIFSVLDNKLLSPNELLIFDDCVELFGKVLRENISVRGDWCLSLSPSDNPLINLFLCFGDLMCYPTYLTNYENAPICILPVNQLLDFSTKFIKILKTTDSYISLVGKG